MFPVFVNRYVNIEIGYEDVFETGDLQRKLFI
jgi:hypothetical protein